MSTGQATCVSIGYQRAEDITDGTHFTELRDTQLDIAGEPAEHVSIIREFLEIQR